MHLLRLSPLMAIWGVFLAKKFDWFIGALSGDDFELTSSE